MWYFGTSTGESKEMATFGWVLLATAFLVLIMVANNSWPWVWAKISGGIPQPGQGNPIVPNPPENAAPFTLTPDPYSILNGGVTPAPPISQQSRTGGQDIVTPPTLTVPTVNGVVQSNNNGITA